MLLLSSGLLSLRWLLVVAQAVAGYISGDDLLSLRLWPIISQAVACYSGKSPSIVRLAMGMRGPIVCAADLVSPGTRGPISVPFACLGLWPVISSSVLLGWSYCD